MQKDNSLKPFVKILSIFLAAILILGVALPYVSNFVVRAESTTQPKGWVITTIERSTIGEGYFLEPVKIPIYEDDTFETFMDRVMATAAKEKDQDYAGNGKDVYSYGVDSENVYTLKAISGGDSGNAVISESIKTLLSEKKENEILNMPAFEETNARRQINGNNLIGYTLSAGMYTAVSQWRMTIDAGTIDPIKNIQFDDGSVLRIRFSLTEDGRDLKMTKDADVVVDEVYELIANLKTQGLTQDENIKTVVDATLKILSKADLAKEEAEKARDELKSVMTERNAEKEKEEELSSAILESESTGSTSLWPNLMMSTAMLTANANEEDSISQKINAVTKTRLAAFEVTPPGIGTYGGDWTIMTLARSNKGNSTLYNQYYEAAVTALQEKGGVLDKNKYTVYSRLIIGLTSIGKDVTNVGGYNLLEYLTDFVKVKKQGLNGPIWALIALDCHDYEMPQNVEGVTEENYNSRARMIEYVLERQKADGGWNLDDDAENSDVDMTGMAMVGLYRHIKANASMGISEELAQKVSTAMQEGLTCLSSMQNETGDFASWGATNVESTVWAYMAMCCMEVDPLTDTRFIKNKTTVLDAIEKYYIEDESYGCGFQHIMGGGWNDMATDQAHYGLVAYKRFENNENFFFDMNDVAITETKIKNISLNQKTGYYELGKTQTVDLKVTVEPVDAPVKSIEWESSDATQAEVDQNGQVNVHLTRESSIDPVVTITCTVIGSDGVAWTDDYEIYSGMSPENVEKVIEELPEPAKLKADDMDNLVFATKAYESLSITEKTQVSEEAREKLDLCQQSASKINHKSLAILSNAMTTEDISYYRLIKVENGDTENDLPWYVQVQAKSVDSSKKTQMKALIGNKTLMQVADISLVDLLSGENYNLSEDSKVKVTMDVPNTSSLNTESAEIIHFKERTEGGFDSETLNSALSLDRQKASFETTSFSSFAYVIKEKESGGSSGGGGGSQSGGGSSGKSSSSSGSSKSGGSTASTEETKTLLEMSGLTLGQSDIQMVDITGTGGLTTSWETIENTAAKVFAQMKVWLPPFAVGCLAMGIAWIISVCVKEGAEARKVKRVNKHINKRNKDKK